MASSLTLRSRTLELCLIFADNVLFIQGLYFDKLDLFCTVCILFLIKIERDFTPKLGDFVSFSISTLNTDANTILKMELHFLLLIPENFVCIATFTELFFDFIEIFSIQSVPTNLQQSLVLEAINYYISGDDLPNIPHLMFEAILTFVHAPLNVQ